MNFSISPSDYPIIIKNTKSLKIRDLSFKYCDWNTPVLGFIVSKKYGNAVKRNLFKRRCRELFKKNIINHKLHMAIIIRPNNNNISYNELNSAFKDLLLKIND